MTPSGRILASAFLLTGLLVPSVLGPAAAGPGGTPPDEPAFARPRAEIPVEGRLRTPTRWSPSVRAAAAGAEATASAGNEGGFLGLSGNGETAPSDTTGAGGPSHVVTAVNASYAVWPRATLTNPPAVVPPLASGTLDSLFPTLPSGSFVFDPKVVYDHYAGRFVLVFVAGHGQPFTAGAKRSRLLIVTIPEATAGDRSTWCLRNLNADQIGRDGKQFGDYPGVGFDRNYLYVTTNQFDFGRAERFRYAQILAFGKQRLYGCAGKLSIRAFGGRRTSDPGRGPAFTIQPAVTETERGLGQAGFLASFQDGSCGFLCGNMLTIWRLKPGRLGLDLAAHEIRVPPGLIAPEGTQRDGSATCNPVEHCWDVGDLRLVTAMYDADRDRLYTAHAVQTDLGPGDGYVEGVVRWYEIDPTPLKRAQVTRTGVVGLPGRDSGWPSVTTDAAGNLFVGYSRAGAPLPGEYLSAALATIPPGATTPATNDILVPGEAMYVDEPGRLQRWGDYSAVNRDPVDPLRVWAVNQYARTDATPPTTNIWQQVVNRVFA